jgi:hypothetical protein
MADVAAKREAAIAKKDAERRLVTLLAARLNIIIGPARVLHSLACTAARACDTAAEHTHAPPHFVAGNETRRSPQKRRKRLQEEQRRNLQGRKLRRRRGGKMRSARRNAKRTSLPRRRNARNAPMIWQTRSRRAGRVAPPSTRRKTFSS